MQRQKPRSIWSKGLNWLTSYAYHQLPVIIATYSNQNSQPKSLSFEDYIRSSQLARQAGLMCVKQMNMDFIKRKQGIQRAITDFKFQKNSWAQKPHEFNCPICLELTNGPVTTSCHHTFCHMCLDEAVLFNPGNAFLILTVCPVCRNQIRGEELIVSKSIEKLILIDDRFLHKVEFEEVEKVVKKELEYEEWIQKRSIKKEQIDIGDCIDVRDTEFIWCRATILDIYPAGYETKSEREAILVHYEGWANVFNEIIPLDSQRLAQYKFYTSREQIPHYNLSADNNQHMRSPVVSGSQINHPPIVLQSSDSFEYNPSQQQIETSPPESEELLGFRIIQQSEYERESQNQPIGDFVDSMEIYYRNNSVLMTSIRLNSNSIRLQQRNSSSIQLPNFLNHQDQHSFQIDQFILTKQKSYSQATFQKLLEIQHSFEGNIRPYKFMQHDFKSSDYIPFNVDIDEIKDKNISLQLKELEKTQKQMQIKKQMYIKIEAEQKGVKSEMQKWNELNKMIDDYFEQTENPEGQIDVEFAIEKDWLYENLEINCLDSHQIKTIQKPDFELEKEIMQNQQEKEANRSRQYKLESFDDQKQEKIQVIQI